MRDLMYQDALKIPTLPQRRESGTRSAAGWMWRLGAALATGIREPGSADRRGPRQHQWFGAGDAGADKYFPGCKKESGLRTAG